jgi:glutaredoxin
MPLRPDFPAGLNLSRRTTTPVKLPKLSYPMVGGVPEGAVEPAHQAPPDAVEGTVPMPEPEPGAPPPAPLQPAQPAPAPVAGEAGRVVVYGRSGCAACLAAIQDLMARQVSFTYYDVASDQRAMQHLQAICGASPVVPVIIYIGFGGT